MKKLLSILLIGFLFFSGFGVIAYQESFEGNNNSNNQIANYNFINIS